MFNAISHQFNSIQFNSILLVQEGNSWCLHAIDDNLKLAPKHLLHHYECSIVQVLTCYVVASIFTFKITPITLSNGVRPGVKLQNKQQRSNRIKIGMGLSFHAVPCMLLNRWLCGIINIKLEFPGNCICVFVQLRDGTFRVKYIYFHLLSLCKLNF